MLEIITPSTTQAITVSDLKSHLRIDHDGENDLLSVLIDASTEYIETETDKAITPKQYRWTTDTICGVMTLPKSPLISVDEIQYFDSDNISQMVTIFGTIKSTNLPSELVIENPSATYIRPDAVTITFTAGFSTVPCLYQLAIRLLAGAYYENREAEQPITLKQFSTGLNRILNLLRAGDYS